MFARLLFCLQPFATVCNRSMIDDCAMAVPMGGVTTFGSFKRCVTLFRVAGAALRGIPTCFVRRRKFFCMTGAILAQGFQKMISIFRDSGNGVPSSFCATSAALQTCRVTCFLRIALSGLRQVVTTRKFCGRGGIL